MNTTSPITFGLWYDFRNPPQWRRPDAEVYQASIDQIARAEALGFDDVEHLRHDAVPRAQFLDLVGRLLLGMDEDQVGARRLVGARTLQRLVLPQPGDQRLETL